MPTKTIRCLALVLGMTMLSCIRAQEISSAKLADIVAKIDHDRILRLADQALRLKPPAITDSAATDSAGGLHDFFSQADYAWPNPTNKSGLPYVGHDAESNPNTFTYPPMAI